MTPRHFATIRFASEPGLVHVGRRNERDPYWFSTTDINEAWDAWHRLTRLAVDPADVVTLYQGGRSTARITGAELADFARRPR